MNGSPTLPPRLLLVTTRSRGWPGLHHREVVQVYQDVLLPGPATFAGVREELKRRARR